MTKLYLLIVLCLCFYIFLHSRWFNLLKKTWRDGLFRPKKETLTMFDVRNLLIKGEKDLAIRVYCKIFNVNPEEACKAVDQIERSIQPKDFEF